MSAAAEMQQDIAAKKWYAVQVLVGFEKNIRQNLLDRIQEHDMGDRFGEILLPIERTLEIQSGKKKLVERKLYPGYLFLEIAVEKDPGSAQEKIRAECWHLVRRTRRVGHFITGALSTTSEDDMPAPLDDNVMDKIRRQMQDSIDKGPVVRAQFTAGDQVRIKEGPFSDFSGTVEAVNLERNRLTVMVMVFGRSTPVELDFSQADKI